MEISDHVTGQNFNWKEISVRPSFLSTCTPMQSILSTSTVNHTTGPGSHLAGELKVTKHMNFDVYYVHQFDNGLGVPTVDAVGLTLKLFWHKGEPFFAKRSGK